MRRRWSHGFTLIETLVVLAVIGIALGMVTLALAPGELARLQIEARRLALLLEGARDEARALGYPMAWRGDARGHGFSRREPGLGWVPFEAPAPYRKRDWPADLRLVGLRINGVTMPIDTPLLFPASGPALPYEVVLGSRARRISLHAEASGRVAVAPPHVLPWNGSP